MRWMRHRAPPKFAGKRLPNKNFLPRPTLTIQTLSPHISHLHSLSPHTSS